MRVSVVRKLKVLACKHLDSGIFGVRYLRGSLSLVEAQTSVNELVLQSLFPHIKVRSLHSCLLINLHSQIHPKMLLVIFKHKQLIGISDFWRPDRLFSNRKAPMFHLTALQF